MTRVTCMTRMTQVTLMTGTTRVTRRSGVTVKLLALLMGKISKVVTDWHVSILAERGFAKLHNWSSVEFYSDWTESLKNGLTFNPTVSKDRPLFELTCMTAGGSDQFTVALFWICFLMVLLVDCISVLARMFVFCERDECISNLFLLRPAISPHGNTS